MYHICTCSIDEFIVDDDDDDLEEDVFMDPGFTPEEYDWDKENDDCIEIATPGKKVNLSLKSVMYM